MLPYLLLFLFTLSLIFFDRENAKPNYFWYFVLFLACSVFSGLRDMIGGYDIFVYAQVYEATVKQILNYQSFEKGFELYFIFLKFFEEDRQFMFFVTAFLISFLHFRVLRKYSPMLYLSLFMLFGKFYLFSFVYLRQFIAMGLIWYMIPYILDKKYWRIGIFLITAYFFHKSSVIIVPLLFIWKIKFKNTSLFFIICAFLVIGLTPLSKLLISNLSETIDDSKVSAYSSKNTSINIFYVIEVVTLAIMLLKFKADFYKTKLGRLILNGVFVYITLNTISLINASFIRFGWYYYIFVILFLTYCYTFIESNKNKTLYKMIVVLYFGLLYFRILINWDGGDMMEYKTIYQNFYRPHLYDSFEYRPRKY